MSRVVFPFVLVALALGACNRSGPQQEAPTGNSAAAKPGAKATPAPVPTVSDQPALSLTIDGLIVPEPTTRQARQRPFGSDQFELTQELGKAIGNFTGQAENADCASGALTSFDYPGGLTLFFQERKFVGWDFDGQGSFATMNNVRIGSALRDLRTGAEVQLQDSAAGTAFTMGDLHGLLDGDKPESKVTNLWAGATCNAG